jgi:putative DNA primase/helicase
MSTLQENMRDSKSAHSIIQGLGGNEANGMCRCPAHDDEKASLKVSTGSSGKVLVKCFGGCLQERVIEALKSRGLWGKSYAPQPSMPERDEGRSGLTKEESFKKAHAIWKADSEEDANKLMPYFKGRGINSVPDGARFLSKSQSNELTGKLFPAMVMQIVDGAGKFKGVQLTWLNRD